MQPTFKRQLQRIMSTEDWSAVEQAFEAFARENFFQGSIRRSTEFETLWQAAEMEGARRCLADFMKYLEDQAKNAE